MKMRLASLFATAFLLLIQPKLVQAQDPGDESLRLYAAEIVHPPQSWLRYLLVLAQTPFVQIPRGSSWGNGVYLGRGLILTAAHVIDSSISPSVRIADLKLPAKIIKKSSFDRMDLALLAVDQDKLPVSLRLRRMPLCRTQPQPGEPVIVATPEGIAYSSIMSPQSLPANLRARFPTVIKDVETTGNSGSGVFDADRGCLLGIMSRKIFNQQKNILGMAKEKDIAKYFVPAATIAAFMPSEYAD